MKTTNIKSGDILIAATDGILSISDQDLITCITPANQTAEKIVASITKMIDVQAHSNQDNLAVCVALIL